MNMNMNININSHNISITINIIMNININILAQASFGSSRHFYLREGWLDLSWQVAISICLKDGSMLLARVLDQSI